MSAMGNGNASLSPRSSSHFITTTTRAAARHHRSSGVHQSCLDYMNINFDRGQEQHPVLMMGRRAAVPLRTDMYPTVGNMHLRAIILLLVAPSLLLR